VTDHWSGLTLSLTRLALAGAGLLVVYASLHSTAG
jgi:hypothetical protein